MLGRPAGHSTPDYTQEIVKIKQCELQSMAHVALEGKEVGKPIVQKYLLDNAFAKIRESQHNQYVNYVNYESSKSCFLSLGDNFQHVLE